MAIKKKQRKQITKQRKSKSIKHKSLTLASRSRPNIKPKPKATKRNPQSCLKQNVKPFSMAETVAMLNGKMFIASEAQPNQVGSTKKRKTNSKATNKLPAKKAKLSEKKLQGGTKPKRVRKPIDTKISKLPVKAVDKPKTLLKIPLAGRLPIIDLISTEEFYRLDKKKPRKREINKVISIKKF